MRIAYFSPLPPQRSGIADYSAELLPHLAARADIDLYVDGFEPAGEELRARFSCFDYRADPRCLRRLSEYDAVVYHAGNDHRYHAGIYDVARAHPGVVVLHDYALQNFFLGLARERGRLNIYLDELEACHGAEARDEAAAQLARGVGPAIYARPVEFPLNCRLARRAEGIIVHSEWSRAMLASVAPATPCAHVPMHAPRDDEPPRPLRAARDGAVEIAAFGHITTEKGIARTLGALAGLRDRYDFHYTLVGQPDHFDVEREIRAAGLGGRVTVTGRVSLEEFKARIAGADICVNLRDRTVGETSASVCRALAAGVPVVVSDVGWFSELPDDCVVKIDAGAAGEAQLREALARLIADAPLRRRVGARARAYAMAEHSIERSADDYLSFISRVVARRPRRRFVNGVADELAACGVTEDDKRLLRGVASEVARVAPARLFDPATSEG